MMKKDWCLDHQSSRSPGETKGSQLRTVPQACSGVEKAPFSILFHVSNGEAVSSHPEKSRPEKQEGLRSVRSVISNIFRSNPVGNLR